MATKNKAAKKTAQVKSATKTKAARGISKDTSAQPKKAAPKPAAKKNMVKADSSKTSKTAKKVAAKVVAVKPASKKTNKKSTVSIKKPAVDQTKVKSALKKPKKPLQATAAQPTTKLPGDLIEKAANTNSSAQSAPAHNMINTTEADPLHAFNKHEYAKATAKNDPQGKIQLSSKPKNAIKPSGKKPLWR